jgi:glutamate racemase
MRHNKQIGVFDSGIGGLSVVKYIISNLPKENLIYFGDIARIPYGNKSIDTIQKFACQTVKFLIEQDVKAIVIACNTISAVALDVVKKLAGNIPVIDVISAGVKSANMGYKKIGIIGTNATINSNAYPNSIYKLNPNIEVISQACPLLVPLIEEGLIKHDALELICRDYLKPLLDKNIEALILGCTHYPIIKDTIQNIIGNSVEIIDPAIGTSNELQTILAINNITNTTSQPQLHKFFVTDMPEKFQKIGEMFLHTPMQSVELVKLE